jgi:hypothetical protein
MNGDFGFAYANLISFTHAVTILFRVGGLRTEFPISQP